jgi:hypothetical protein
MPQTAAFLKRLRKKHGLGEFAVHKKKRKKRKYIYYDYPVRKGGEEGVKEGTLIRMRARAMVPPRRRSPLRRGGELRANKRNQSRSELNQLKELQKSFPLR